MRRLLKLRDHPTCSDWGGVGGEKKISWVKRKSVCQQKRNGGLGVKNVRVMNVSLLAMALEIARWRKDSLEGGYRGEIRF